MDDFETTFNPLHRAIDAAVPLPRGEQPDSHWRLLAGLGIALDGQDIIHLSGELEDDRLHVIVITEAQVITASCHRTDDQSEPVSVTARSTANVRRVEITPLGHPHGAGAEWREFHVATVELEAGTIFTYPMGRWAPRVGRTALAATRHFLAQLGK